MRRIPWPPVRSPVLRQYRLLTVFAGRRKAILIPFAPFAFDWKIALRFRPLLAPNLLDASLASNFDAILRYNLGSDLYAPTQPAAPTPQYFTGTQKVVVDPKTPTSAVAFGVGLIQKGSKVQTVATADVQAIKFDPADPKNYDADGVPVRVYRPAGAAGSLPGLLYIHGGGYAIGSIGTEDPIARMLASGHC